MYNKGKNTFVTLLSDKGGYFQLYGIKNLGYGSDLMYLDIGSYFNGSVHFPHRNVHSMRTDKWAKECFKIMNHYNLDNYGGI